MVHFVGAGCGALDLITVRGQRLLWAADVVVYAGSLVNPKLLEACRADCVCHDSSRLTLEEVLAIIEEAEGQGKMTVRLHTGDPSLYGAIREQMDELDRRGICYDIVPGVSSFCGAAAALGMEYTLPDVSQSVVITRMEGMTPVPPREQIEAFAAHQATMVLFLSVGMTEMLQKRLIAGGYPADTPAAIVYKASWPEEKICRTTVGGLAAAAKAQGITKTALVIVGRTVAQTDYARSKLYDPDFTTGFRKSQPETGDMKSGTGRPEQGDMESGTGRHASGGRVFVVGIGPGAPQGMTVQAQAALAASDVVVGYTVYVQLVREAFPDKEFLSTPMKKEAERCRMAFAQARKGKTVAMVCSGDAGVYGMGGLMLEMGSAYEDVEVELVAGVSACISGAALLGAPLTNDFAVISLSDLLTPWETIEKRLRMAAAADLAICLYNPSSKKRSGHLARACDIIMEYQPGDTVCGIAKNIARPGENVRILPLGKLRDASLDMFCTVFIGNSLTKEIRGKMVTPRGYRL